MAENATAPALRETSRLLVRVAEAALGAGLLAFIVLMVSGAGLAERVVELSRSQGEEALASSGLELGGLVGAALTVLKLCMAIAILAGIGAAITASRAARQSDEEIARKLSQLRRTRGRAATS